MSLKILGDMIYDTYKDIKKNIGGGGGGLGEDLFKTYE